MHAIDSIEPLGYCCCQLSDRGLVAWAASVNMECRADQGTRSYGGRCYSQHGRHHSDIDEEGIQANVHSLEVATCRCSKICVGV